MGPLNYYPVTHKHLGSQQLFVFCDWGDGKRDWLQCIEVWRSLPSFQCLCHQRFTRLVVSHAAFDSEAVPVAACWTSNSQLSATPLIEWALLWALESSRESMIELCSLVDYMSTVGSRDYIFIDICFSFKYWWFSVSSLICLTATTIVKILYCRVAIERMLLWLPWCLFLENPLRLICQAEQVCQSFSNMRLPIFWSWHCANSSETYSNVTAVDTIRIRHPSPSRVDEYKLRWTGWRKLRPCSTKSDHFQ